MKARTLTDVFSRGIRPQPDDTREPVGFERAGGLLGLLYGVPWAVPTLPAPAQTFVDAGIEGVLWLGTAGFVLHGAERAGLLTLPWRDEGDADVPRAPAG